MVVFSLSEPIRNSILNYSKFMSSLDLDKFKLDPNSVPCHCSDFPDRYRNVGLGHIVTVDLTIVRNSKLQKLLLKGPKYRVPVALDFDTARDGIETQLAQYIECISDKNKYDANIFDNWKHYVLNAVDNKN